MGNFGDKSKIKYYGRIKDAPHEVPGRQDDWSENRVQGVTFIGKYDDVKAKMDSLRPGLPMGTFNSWTDKAFAGNTFIRTMSLVRGDGDTGELHVTDVRCPRGAEQPYNKVWEVGMEEVVFSRRSWERFKSKWEKQAGTRKQQPPRMSSCGGLKHT